MSNIPENCKFTKSHEWVRIEADGQVTIGITDHAQAALGDLVFIELPETDSNVAGSEDVVVVESVKAASDVYAPIAGQISAVNQDLQDNPAAVNSDPYGDGWIFKLLPENAGSVEQLMDAAQYKEFLDQSE